MESPGKRYILDEDSTMHKTNDKFLPGKDEYLEGGEGIEMRKLGNPKANEVMHDLNRLKDLKKCAEMSPFELLNKAVQEVTFTGLTIVSHKVQSHASDLEFVEDKLVSTSSIIQQQAEVIRQMQREIDEIREAMKYKFDKGYSSQEKRRESQVDTESVLKVEDMQFEQHSDKAKN